MNTDDKFRRTPAPVRARQFARLLKKENPDYGYLREIFRNLRKILKVEPGTPEGNLPYVPDDDEIRKYYDAVWQSGNAGHIMIIRTFLYTGMKVGELVNVRIDDVDLNLCRIRIRKKKSAKTRYTPFPESFRDAMAVHIGSMKKSGAVHLFESSWKKPYSDRGIRKIMEAYTVRAGLHKLISPTKLRTFLLTWMKKQGIEDIHIMPISGIERPQSMDIYSDIAEKEAREQYGKVIQKLPV